MKRSSLSRDMRICHSGQLSVEKLRKNIIKETTLQKTHVKKVSEMKKKFKTKFQKVAKNLPPAPAPLTKKIGQIVANSNFDFYTI